MDDSTNANTILKLKETFSVFGLPVELVLDNGSFNISCQANRIKLVKTSPYHSQSNGIAETSVQTIKKDFKKSLFSEKVEVYKTGGGAFKCQIDPIGEKFLALNANVQEIYDSDTPFREEQLLSTQEAEETGTVSYFQRQFLKLSAKILVFKAEKEPSTS
ncbi:hypothetical protein ILUMI_06284 [Ignelater luminosus]|uniref:Integrase catalytic domain-containing protein n=1 Tax=Ignelater luminosus TaxID=2038154 RepID=A0A8K0DAL5_IGNLU|nr:hypothetical protein ILUMI_06284 [Ignelater luminosus]